MGTPNTKLVPPVKAIALSNLHGGISKEIIHLTEQWIRNLGAWGFFEMQRQVARPVNPQDYSIWVQPATFDKTMKLLTEPQALIYDPLVSAYVDITPAILKRMFAGDAADGVITGGSITGSKLTLTRSIGNPVDIDVSALTSKNVVSGAIVNTELVLTMSDNTAIKVDVSSLVGGGTTDGVLSGASLDANNVLQLTLSQGNPIAVDLSSLAGGGTGSDGVVSGAALVGSKLSLSRTSGLPNVEVDLATLFTQLDVHVTGGSLTGTNLKLTRTNATDIVIDLSSLAGGGGGTDNHLSVVSLEANNNLKFKMVSGTTFFVDLSSLAGGGGGTDIHVTSGSLTGTNLKLTRANATDIVIDLSSLAGGGTGADGVITGASLSSSNVLNLTRSIGTDITVNLSSLSGGTGSNDGVVTGATLSSSNVLNLTRSVGSPITVNLSSLSGGGSTGVTAKKIVRGDAGGAGGTYDDIALEMSDGSTILSTGVLKAGGDAWRNKIMGISKDNTDLVLHVNEGADFRLSGVFKPDGWGDNIGSQVTNDTNPTPGLWLAQINNSNNTTVASPVYVVVQAGGAATARITEDSNQSPIVSFSGGGSGNVGKLASDSNLAWRKVG